MRDGVNLQRGAARVALVAAAAVNTNHCFIDSDMIVSDLHRSLPPRRCLHNPVLLTHAISIHQITTQHQQYTHSLCPLSDNALPTM